MSWSRWRAFVGIGCLDDAAEFDRELNESAHVLHAFGFIGVEQTRPPLVLRSRRAVSSEVGGVAQTGAHALAKEWRHLVRGIARQASSVRAAISSKARNGKYRRRRVRSTMSPDRYPRAQHS